MVTLARILNAIRDAEQMNFPLDARSLLWHLLLIPQYGLSIFSLWTYTFLSKRVADTLVYQGDESFFLNWRLVSFVILTLDLIVSWFAFEFFLEFLTKVT